MRDILFKRYSDVSFLLRSMRLYELPEFLVYVFKETNNDELWEVWMANPFRDGNFEDFKREVIEEARERQKPKEQVEYEATQAAEKALANLNQFGGDVFGN